MLAKGWSSYQAVSYQEVSETPKVFAGKTYYWPQDRPFLHAQRNSHPRRPSRLKHCQQLCCLHARIRRLQIPWLTDSCQHIVPAQNWGTVEYEGLAASGTVVYDVSSAVQMKRVFLCLLV